jgi:Putative Na+/H+ antiporter
LANETIQTLGTILFAVAVLHTFCIKLFQHLALRFPLGSVQENLFHLLGEVEIVFGLCAGLLVAGMALVAGGHEAIHYLESANFTEPVFVFVIMSVAATRPVLDFAKALIGQVARLRPLPGELAFYLVTGCSAIHCPRHSDMQR